MSARTRLIVAIAGALVVLLLFYFLFIRPRRAELVEVRDQVAQEEQRTAGLQADLGRLRQLQENAPKLRAELEKVTRLVPDDHEVANFIFQVQEIANEAGVGFVRIDPELPKQPPEGAALAEVRVQMGASGGYFAVQDFLRRLYDLDRAVRIDQLSMTSVEDALTGEFTIDVDITARIFFQLPEGTVPGAATDPALAPTTPPPAEASPAPETTETLPAESPAPAG